ncbi:MAG TPA: hypothetical protein EYG97_00965 [Arcobacter sp.]|nr:hypothetical protein [Arcobacter sp.]HIP55574.1 hypothetical protein [Arcobacter sp.]
MNYDNLTNEQKEEISNKINNDVQSVGGVNFYLALIESLRETKPNALLNKTAKFHYPKGTIDWSKSIYKETLTALFNAMKKEERDGDMLDGLKPRDYKSTMNMMKVLKPIIITINPKDEECEGFSFPILDTSEAKKTKVSLAFKILFFYNIEFAKKALNFKDV